MSALRIIAGSRIIGKRPHTKSVACFYVHDRDGVVVSDHPTRDEAERAAGISPRSLAEIGAIAGLAAEVMHRWPNLFLTMPSGRLMFEHVGIRLRDGDPLAAEVIEFLRSKGAVV